MSQYGEPISLDPDRDIHGTEFYSGFTPNGGKSTLWEDIENPLAERMVKCMNDCAGIDDPAATIRDLRAENEILRDALLFYEAEDVYEPYVGLFYGQMQPVIMGDRGRRARAALSKVAAS